MKKWRLFLIWGCLIVGICFPEVSMSGVNTKGWPKAGYDLGWTSFYPYASSGSIGTFGAKWTAPVSLACGPAAPTVADINGDGYLEAIVISDSSTSINVYSHTGNLLWSDTISGITGYNANGSLLLKDIDGDTIPEIFFGYRDNSNNLKINVYKGDGTLIKTLNRGASAGTDCGIYPLEIKGDTVICLVAAGFAVSPRGLSLLSYSGGNEKLYYAFGPHPTNMPIGDVNNDGSQEVLLGGVTTHNGVSGNGTTDDDLYIALVNEHGQNLFTKKLSDWGCSTHGGVAGCFSDLDNDGKTEILVFEGKEAVYPGTTHIHLVSETGALVATWNGPSDGGQRRYLIWSIADVNSDGKKEILVSAEIEERIYSVKYDLSSTLVTSAVGAGFVMGTCDIDGDGNIEIIAYQTSSQKIRVLHSDLSTELYSYNVGQVSFNGVSNALSISDIDNDGKNELLIVGDNGTKLYVLGDITAATRLKITSSPFSNSVNNPSSAITVEAQNNAGAKDTTFNETITLYSSSSGGRFSQDSVNWSTSNNTFILLTSGAGAFYYKDLELGRPIITVSRSGPISDTQTVTILAQVISGIPVIYGPSGTYFWSSDAIAIGDIDNDGIKEIVAGYTDTPTLTPNSFIIYKWVGNGYTQICKTSIPSGEAGEISIGIGDVNNDGDSEIVVLNASPSDQNPNGKIRIHKYNGSTCQTLWSDTLTEGFRQIAIGNLDADPAQEIVIGNSFYDRTIYVYDYQGGTNWSKVTVESVAEGCFDIKIADVDNDGQNEIVAGLGVGSPYSVRIYEYNAGTYEKIWTYSFCSVPPYGPEYYVAVGDVNNDGKNEMLVTEDMWDSSKEGNPSDVFIFTHTGGNTWTLSWETGFPLPNPGAILPYIGQVQNSGVNEFIFLSHDTIYVYRWIGSDYVLLGTSTGWNFVTSFQATSRITGGDVDNDGKHETIINKGNAIYIFDTLLDVSKISGKVTKPDSEPITGVIVDAMKSGSVVKSTTTYTDGTYQLSGLDIGTYTVRASWILNQITSSVQIAMPAGTVDGTFTLSVTCQLAQLGGMVAQVKSKQTSFSFGHKVMTAESDGFVQLSQKGRILIKVPADAIGNYSIPHLLPGKYTAKAFNGYIYSEPVEITLMEGQFLTFNFTFASLPEEQVYTYPNPTKVGSLTFHLYCGYSPPELTIRVYNIAGEFVKEISDSEINRSAAPIYEYLWDCKNTQNENVASGVYIYQVIARDKATSEQKQVIKKLAIIR